jgi:hypothetical protein
MTVMVKSVATGGLHGAAVLLFLLLAVKEIRF